MDSGSYKQRLRGNKKSVLALVTLPTGELASGFRDKTIIIWNMDSVRIKQRLRGNKESV